VRLGGIDRRSRLTTSLFLAHIDEAHLALGVEQARVEVVRLLEHVVGDRCPLFLQADAEIVVACAQCGDSFTA
jgi:hypothetical protein